MSTKLRNGLAAIVAAPVLILFIWQGVMGWVAVRATADDAQARSMENEKGLDVLKEGQVKIQKYIDRQETAKEAADTAERETIDRLCNQGKLKGRECR